MSWPVEVSCEPRAVHVSCRRGNINVVWMVPHARQSVRHRPHDADTYLTVPGHSPLANVPALFTHTHTYTLLVHTQRRVCVHCLCLSLSLSVSPLVYFQPVAAAAAVAHTQARTRDPHLMSPLHACSLSLARTR